MIKSSYNRTWGHHWIDPSSYRGRTGYPPNPNHRIPYRNHPYETFGRVLSDKEDIKHLYKPIRIRYFTETLSLYRTKENKNAIDFVKNAILPRVAKFWSNTLSVIPVDGPLKINKYDLHDKKYCGFPELNVFVNAHHIHHGIDGADMVWYISASHDPGFCSESTLALAMPCNFDQYDRPTAGVMNFCLDSISDSYISESYVENSFYIAAHEAGHILGLVATALPYFYDSSTGKPRTERPFKYSSVTCVTGNKKDVILPNENTVSFA